MNQEKMSEFIHLFLFMRVRTGQMYQERTLNKPFGPFCSPKSYLLRKNPTCKWKRFLPCIRVNQYHSSHFTIITVQNVQVKYAVNRVLITNKSIISSVKLSNICLIFDPNLS